MTDTLTRSIPARSPAAHDAPAALASAFADARAGDYMSMARLRAAVQAYATAQRVRGVPPEIVIATLNEIAGIAPLEREGESPDTSGDRGLATQIEHWTRPTIYPLL